MDSSLLGRELTGRCRVAGVLHCLLRRLLYSVFDRVRSLIACAGLPGYRIAAGQRRVSRGGVLACAVIHAKAGGGRERSWLGHAVEDRGVFGG